ncbi:hypothetical protein GNAINCEL_00087 [Serratia phage KKP 3709]|nr:hypothetical protein GNAINCEL_00087 [Serratia phage KKP 3709]
MRAPRPLVEALAGIDIIAGVEDAIHPATLKSWAKERVEAGDSLASVFRNPRI